MSKIIEDLKDKKFGRLLVTEFTGRTKQGEQKWKCLCDCGNYKITLKSSLILGKTKSCGCFHKESASKQGKLTFKGKGVAGFNSIKKKYEISAVKRNYEFNLADEDLKKLFSGLCYYCNEKPKQVSKPTSTRGSYTFNGIDRLDNNKGYNLDNCVSCCKKCNYAKRDMSIEEFKNWIIKVFNNIESIE